MIQKFFYTVCAAFLLSLTGIAQQVKHVVLITVDGFRPDFYLDTPWHTPHMHELMQGGTYAKGVNSVFPSMTYPSHTTIVTGVQPAKHGVYYNDMFVTTGKPTYKNYWNDTSIHMPTIWKAVHDKGLKVAALLWPVSADAPVDYNIPDIGGLGEIVREAYSKPAGFVPALKKEVFGSDKIEYGKNQNIARIAAYVIKKDQPALMTIHFFSVDHAEHEQGRTGEMVKEAVADADEAVGIIEDALKQQGIWDSSVIIVTGDHGFHNVSKMIMPNVWLKNAGLLNDKKNNDWKAQFNAVSGSAYLYLKDKNDQATLKQVTQLYKSLPDSINHYFRVISREKLDAIGANPEVALALSAENDASFGNESTGEAIRPGKGGAHGHFPDHKEIQTGFIAYGPGIKAGGVITEMNVRDIAPIVARILGFPFPSADGKIPAGIFY